MHMDDLLTRQVPQSLEAEQSVLGSMLIDEPVRAATSSASSAPEDFYLQAEPRDLRDDLRRCSTISRGHRPGHRARQDAASGAFMTKNSSTKYLMQLMEITPTAANVKQLLRRSSTTRRCCATCRHGRRRASSRRSTRASARRRRSWRQRRRRSTPCGAATRASQSRAHRHGAAEGLRPPGGAGGVRQRHPGPVHRPARSRPEVINGLNKSDLAAAGGPTRHGQDVHGAERRAERRKEEPAEDRGVFLARNVAASSWSRACSPTRALWTTRSSSPASSTMEDWSKIGHRGLGPEPDGHPRGRQSRPSPLRR